MPPISMPNRKEVKQSDLYKAIKGMTSTCVRPPTPPPIHDEMYRKMLALSTVVCQKAARKNIPNTLKDIVNGTEYLCFIGLPPLHKDINAPLKMTHSTPHEIPKVRKAVMHTPSGCVRSK